MKIIPLYLIICLSAAACNSNAPVKPDTNKKNNIEADTKALTDRRLLNISETDWHKILVAGTAVFDGFELRGRNLNYLDLRRYSFNYALLKSDTLYKVKAISSDTFETASNSFRYMYLNNSVMSDANFKNWHFVADDLTLSDYWFSGKIYNTEFNDVVMRKIGINACMFNNCFFRNTNYGSFKNVRFNRDTLQNCFVENAFFYESEFYGNLISGNIFTSRFEGCKFGNALGGLTTNTVFLNMPRIQGKFTGCQFNTGVKFNKSNILESEFTGGSFTEVEFLQDSYIKNSFFKNVTFMNVKFGITGLWEVRFGDSTATNKMLMSSCDFRQVKWGPNVKFYNVNLIGSVFPARSVLNGYGVQFIGCQNEPQ